MYYGPEHIAREQIDRMLVSAGWAVQDAKTVNLYAKQGVAIRDSSSSPVTVLRTICSMSMARLPA